MRKPFSGKWMTRGERDTLITAAISDPVIAKHLRAVSTTVFAWYPVRTVSGKLVFWKDVTRLYLPLFGLYEYHEITQERITHDG